MKKTNKRKIVITKFGNRVRFSVYLPESTMDKMDKLTKYFKTSQPRLITAMIDQTYKESKL